MRRPVALTTVTVGLAGFVIALSGVYGRPLVPVDLISPSVIADAADPGRGTVPYDIVYVRAPRRGDDVNTRWPEVFDPIRMDPGADLVLLHPDGTEEVLVEGGNGSVVDPYVSFDGLWIYYAKFHDLRREALNMQRRSDGVPIRGADIYKINVKTREIVRLTSQEWTPNTGAANWSKDPLDASAPGKTYLGYGIFNLGPCPLPGGKIMFTSSRNSFVPNKGYTFPNLQLFVMDEDGKNVEQVGHFNLGSALHPTVLMDGRVMFSTYEGQGLRDKRLWALWAIWPDGRHWEPLVSAFVVPSAFHFMSQLSRGDIVVEEYYNLNNNGFGTLVAFPPASPEDRPAFGDPRPRHPSNLASLKYPFSPYGLRLLTPFAHGKDNAASKDQNGEWMGKVTHPSGAPENDLLLVWTPGPANNLRRPVNRPVVDGGLYLLRGGGAVQNPGQLLLIKNDPRYNEMQPRAVVPYRAIYGIDEPAEYPWLPNDGTASPLLPAGTPFGLVGSSSLVKRNTAPGVGDSAFDGLDPFNSSGNESFSNWRWQGADAGKYTNDDIYAVRILTIEPTTHRSYGQYAGATFFNHANERLRILGEIPVLKRDATGRPVMDVDGNPDTSFLAKVPADVPFTFQTLDRNGLVLNMSQTWHQLRPGEIRNDCGGCHAHAQLKTDFGRTAAARPEYVVPDLTRATPLLHVDEGGATTLREESRAVDVEYYRDIKPILQRSCVQCHSVKGRAEAQLALDDDAIIGGVENTYNRLANDAQGKFGLPPMLERGWRDPNASRYIRKFQSRRSLLVWKLFGRRLDGWANDDHPTETVPGDRSTFPAGVSPNLADIDYVGTVMPPSQSGVPPLTSDDKLTIARWIDLGCPITRNEPGWKEYGWFLDDLRPTLTVSLPRAGVGTEPLTLIRVGAYDYYSGLDMSSFSVTASFPVAGRRAGAELAPLFTQTNDHVWTLDVKPGIADLPRGELRVSIKDRQGNVTRVVRTFSVQPTRSPAPTL